MVKKVCAVDTLQEHTFSILKTIAQKNGDRASAATSRLAGAGAGGDRKKTTTNTFFLKNHLSRMM
ncbi:MAG: hypothetical protein F6K41_16255 [Symploca sp. SIO3E6]|nr:hypothetical protein [Caldora sp. SIO3E6]